MTDFSGQQWGVKPWQAGLSLASHAVHRPESSCAVRGNSLPKMEMFAGQTKPSNRKLVLVEATN